MEGLFFKLQIGRKMTAPKFKFKLLYFKQTWTFEKRWRVYCNKANTQGKYIQGSIWRLWILFSRLSRWETVKTNEESIIRIMCTDKNKEGKSLNF